MRVLGGKPSSPFHDDIWTLKYLPKFKWNDLSASIAHQRAIEQAVLRNEISQSKKAQASYLNQVDKARVLQKRREKEEEAGKPAKKPKVDRDYKQRKTIGQKKQTGDEGSSEGRKSSAALQGVMDSLFA